MKEDKIPKRGVFTAYCTADGYDIKSLQQKMETLHSVFLYKDVLFVSMQCSDSIGNAFFFPYGVVVFWGMTKEEEKGFLEDTKLFRKRPILGTISESLEYAVSSSTRMIAECLYLGDTTALTRLAASYALAQSVRLESFEMVVQKSIEDTKTIPGHLAKYGKIPLSRKQIRKKMGTIFIERSGVNLHFELLYVPDFFWEHAELEPIYKLVSRHLDVISRIEILNKQLDVLRDLFEMLGTELNNQRSSRLEWIIIWLILIEVALSLLRDVFKLL